MDNTVNTYDPAELRGGGGGPNKKKFTWKKGLVIFAIILAAIVAIGVAIWYFSGTVSGNDGEKYVSDTGTVDMNSPYIGQLSVEGTISEEDSSSLLSSSTYHHQWLLNRIDDMMADKENKGIILFVNTPGGSVYASDELYLKIKEYQQKTGRPVYSYMASEAASGGYYISSPCDRIVANRNCWTGSIGVTIGTLYDVTGLLKKLGVKTVTITSGKNKAMGSSAVKMTKQQKRIFQGLVDEAYEQFVGVVADGRNMSTAKVKKLADGRVYTAKQAKANGLIDQIATYDEAVADMQSRYKIPDAQVEKIEYDSDQTAIEKLINKVATAISGAKASSSGSSSVSADGSVSNITYDQIKILLGENNKFTVTYMSSVIK